MPVGGIGLVLLQVLLVGLWLLTAVVTGLKGKWGSLVVGFVFWPVWIVAALRMARPRSKWAEWFYPEDKNARARARAENPRYLVLVAAGFVLSLVLVAALFALFKAYRIPGASMEPTLHCATPGDGCEAAKSDRVLVLREAFGGDPARGALIAYRLPDEGAARCGLGGTYLHRVVGLPGERMALQNGKVFVDGKPLSEPYVAGRLNSTESFGPISVPAKSYFVLGDNRTHACDSRVWGMVPRENVVGRVVYRYWPPGRWGTP